MASPLVAVVRVTSFSASTSKNSTSKIPAAATTEMDAAAAAADALAALAPTWSAAVVLLSYRGYLAFAGAVLPGKLVAGAVLPDSSRLHYRCNGLLSLLLLLGLSALGVYMGYMTPTIVADRGLELLSATLIFSVLVVDSATALYRTDCYALERQMHMAKGS